MSLGFLLPNLGPNQLAFDVIKEVNSYLQKSKLVDIYAFYETLTQHVIRPNFAVMTLQEAFTLSGTLVPTTCHLAYDSLRMARRKNIIFYVHKLEWLHGAIGPYEWYDDIYRKLPIVARSDDYARILENNFSANVVDVSPTPNVTTLLKATEKLCLDLVT